MNVTSGALRKGGAAGGDGAAAEDPAEAIRQAMAASKARGGGSLFGGAWKDDNAARPTAAGRVALGRVLPPAHALSSGARLFRRHVFAQLKS